MLAACGYGVSILFDEDLMDELSLIDHTELMPDPFDGGRLGAGVDASVPDRLPFVAAWIVFAFAIFFLPLDYASYALDRRHLSFRQKRRWLLDHAPAVTGFGLAAFGICWVPGLNFFATPMMVVDGTLLALRYEPTPVPPS